MSSPRRSPVGLKSPRQRVQQPTMVDWMFICLCIAIGAGALVAGVSGLLD